MLLYIHVPFCRKKCHYCAFHSLPLTHQDQVKSYTKTLLQEMALWAPVLNSDGKKDITSIFFGGGTPSLLSPQHINSIINAASRHFNLAPNTNVDADAGAEITMEANPESLGNAKRCKDFLHAGINRLSLGVQSLDDKLLKAIGRPHSAQEAILAYATARNSGFENISLDFMWGLPSQSTAQWLQQLRAVIELGPEHLSCYGLTIEEGTPLESMVHKSQARQKGQDGQNGQDGQEADEAQQNLVFADEKSQEAMFLEGSALLQSAGYAHYEISNFAQEDCQCRHNLGYWTAQDYLGLGPAAVSAFYGTQAHAQRRTNPYNHEAWAQAIHEGIKHGHIAYHTAFAGDVEELSPHIMAEEYIMLALRTSRGILFAEYTAHTGHDFILQHGDLAKALSAQGLANLDAQSFRLTTQGMLASNDIMERFF